MYVVPRNAAVLDASAPHRRPGCDEVVQGQAIREVADRPIAATSATVIDALRHKGRRLDAFLKAGGCVENRLS
jgi:hypothetical protein